MDEMNTMEMSQETNVSTGKSRFDNLATGFCLTGAALSIGSACIKVGKVAWKKIKSIRKKDEAPEYFPEDEE